MRMRPLLGSLVAVSVLALSVGSAYADSPGSRSWTNDDAWNGGRHGHSSSDRGDRQGRYDRADDRHGGGRSERWASGRDDRSSRFRDRGYESSRRDHDDHDRRDDNDDALAWLAIAGLTLVTIGVLSQPQQFSYEAAQAKATTVPLGETVVWRNGDAHGSVTPVREGQSTYGRYCREFQQIVTIGGREENAYGTACRDADGSWGMVTPGD